MAQLYIKIIKKVFFDSILPAFCLSCEVRGDWFCNSCLAKSKFNRAAGYCIVCLRYAGGEGRLCVSHKRDLGLQGLVGALSFREEATKKLIHSMKYESVHSAIPEITQKSYQLLEQFFIKNQFDAIIPIPLSLWRFRERGYNQSEIIAKTLANRLGIKINLDLKKVKETESQASLSRTQRISNLDNAFAYEGILSGKVLLVDDVATTGSTLKSAASALKSAGAKEVWAFTLAYEPKQS